jgi:hypothetical protein
LVALVAVVVAAPMTVVFLSLFLRIKTGSPIQVDVGALAKEGFVQLWLFLVFAGGFLWEYSRLRPK